MKTPKKNLKNSMKKSRKVLSFCINFSTLLCVYSIFFTNNFADLTNKKFKKKCLLTCRCSKPKPSNGKYFPKFSLYNKFVSPG